MMIPGGLFITFDGQDGCGKTTQIHEVSQSLLERGYEVKITREPGGSAGAELIRNLVKEGKADRWDALSELMLFSAARHNHLENTVRPALEQGMIVLCDRYVASTYAYQGYGGNLDLAEVTTLCKLATSGLMVDLGFNFFAEGDLRKQRLLARGEAPDRFEMQDAEFQARVNKGYLNYANYYSRHFHKASSSIYVKECDSVEVITRSLCLAIIMCFNNYHTTHK